MTQSLAAPVMMRLLVCLAVVTVPHFPHLPVWESVLVGALLMWRALAHLRRWPMPPVWLRGLLAFLAFLGVLVSYGRVNGQHAGVALLVSMIGLKLTELQEKRDYIILIFSCYFLLITHFLFSQEIWMVILLLGAAVLITAALLEVSHPQGPLPVRTSLRDASTLILHSLPLMVIFFILFPRIPGPLWGLPSDTGSSRPGLSDKMEPGSFSALSRSGDVAFRVHFVDRPPPADKLYWRGPILWWFDGKTWSVQNDPPNIKPAPPETHGDPIRYDVILEPNNQRWLLALDIPGQVPGNAYQAMGYQLVQNKPVEERIRYRTASYVDYRIQKELPPQLRALALQLPLYGNPRSRELAQRWRAEGLNDEAIVRRALQTFKVEKFTYTLQPPALGRNSVDDFLFATKSGFCEHYASAFAFLMRAAGIPTRIVAGYQGGEYNAAGDYFILYQFDAHAWTEVWLEGHGWVRVDPTATVTPERIELGLAAALPLRERSSIAGAARRGVDWMHQARLRWDWVNDGWNRWILAYGPDLQQAFLKRFGLPDWYHMTLALTVLVVTFLSGLGLMLLWQARPTGSGDPVQRLWEKFCARLARRELPRLPHEGPRDYAERVIRARPDLQSIVARVRDLYIGLRYAAEADAEMERELAQQVGAFRP